MNGESVRVGQEREEGASAFNCHKLSCSLKVLPFVCPTLVAVGDRAQRVVVISENDFVYLEGFLTLAWRGYTIVPPVGSVSRRRQLITPYREFTSIARV